MSMAIKYAMQKQAKKSRGGACDEHGSSDCEMCHGGEFAKGGEVEKDQQGVNNSYSGKRGQGTSEAGLSAKGAHWDREKGHEDHYERGIERSKDKHKKTLSELRSMKKPNLYAEGGFVEEEEQSGYEDMPEDDMISRIMKQRYSKGGRVSNDTPITADFEDNQFDDLVKDDDLEMHYTGKNSGDEIGNEKMDEDDRDLIARIMKSRRSKDRMPQPM